MYGKLRRLKVHAFAKVLQSCRRAAKLKLVQQEQPIAAAEGGEDEGYWS